MFYDNPDQIRLEPPKRQSHTHQWRCTRARRSVIGDVLEPEGRDVAFPPTKVWFAADSPLEGKGFEPSVPLLRQGLDCCRREIPDR